MTSTSGTDTTTTRGDLVTQLLAQHDRVRAAINDVANTTTAESRQSAFEALRDLLEQHETAEEAIVHPLTRELDRGRTVAAARNQEETEAKAALAELETLDIASVEFARAFEKFAYAVLTHAQFEESEEFPLLLEEVDAETLANAEQQLLAAEKDASSMPSW